MFGLEKSEVTRPPISPNRAASTQRTSATPKRYCPTPMTDTIRRESDEKKTKIFSFFSLQKRRAKNQVEVRSAAVKASTARPYPVRAEEICKSRMSSTKKSAKSNLGRACSKKDFKDHKSKNKQIGKSHRVECFNS